MNEFIDAMREPLVDSKEKVIYLENIAKLSRAAENMVNNMSFDPVPVVETILEDLYLRRLMTYITISFIKEWAQAEDYRMDDRNKAAVMFCREINEMEPFQVLKDEYFPRAYNKKDPGFIEVACEFTKNTFRFHRTLLQTFAGFVFTFIAKDEKVIAFCRINDEMTERYYRGWTRLPFI